MTFVVEIFIVAFALIGQARLFPENQPARESEFERIVLPEGNPESVLAQRAIRAEGLCRMETTSAIEPGPANGPAADTANDTLIAQNLGEACP